MAKYFIADLVAQLHSGKLDRRDFMKRATAAGVTATLAAQAVARFDAVSAQDADAPLGQAGVEHITDTSKGVIKIHSSWPLTATMEKLGVDAVTAAQLAFADFGDAAGGYSLVYESFDDGVAANEGRWEAGKETENATRAIGDAEVMVYMGTYNSGAAKISIPLMNEANMAQISFANTYPGLTIAFEGATEEGEPDLYYPSGKRNYMRVCPADHIQGGAGARWAYTEMGKRNAFILHDNSLYGKGVADVFANTFTELGGTVAENQGWDATAGDYQTIGLSAADKAPDVIYLGGTVDQNAAKLMQDVRANVSADQAIVIGADGLTNDPFVQGSAGAAEGIYLTFAGYTPDKLLEQGGPGGDFVTRIKPLVGDVNPDSYAVYSYETAIVVMNAIDKAGVNDRTAILDTMFATEGFNSILGFTWSFNEFGDTDSSLIGLAQVIDDAITFQKIIV